MAKETKPGKKYSPMTTVNIQLQTSVYIDDSVDWEPGRVFNDKSAMISLVVKTTQERKASLVT